MAFRALRRKPTPGCAVETFLETDSNGRIWERRVFSGDGGREATCRWLTGAGNPYRWCEAAVRTAYTRRQILSRLVAYWFGDRLRLPRTYGWQWNAALRAFELHCEHVDGHRPPPLSARPSPGGEPPADDSPTDELARKIMRPLQRQLVAAGCHGLAWPAGLGNPAASGHFLLESKRDAAGRQRWVWTGLESDAPAVFAATALDTLGFYLPRALRHLRWLFDDVDVARLRHYVAEHTAAIERAIGPPGLGELRVDVEELALCQQEWKAIPRHLGSIADQLAQGRITASQAEHYRRRPLRWTARLAADRLGETAER